MVRKDLIKRELEELETQYGTKLEKLKLSAKFMYWVLNHYRVEEFRDMFYDSEPDFDDEEYSMYLDYELIRGGTCFSNEMAYLTSLYIDEIQEKGKDFRYSRKAHSDEELEKAHESILRQIAEHEETKLTTNNWTDVYSADILEGNQDAYIFEDKTGDGVCTPCGWMRGRSQKEIDKMARERLKEIKQESQNYEERLFYSGEGDCIIIYYFGRDFLDTDFLWVYKRK